MSRRAVSVLRAHPLNPLVRTQSTGIEVVFGHRVGAVAVTVVTYKDEARGTGFNKHALPTDANQYAHRYDRPMR